ncbi:MAG TPA: dTDP-4-dehydrorhamnose reductase [Puia sp.]|jgi:dTDP-4-dehydrorhamnose reductase|nr:dTDP-4-dehydrorhamnose reductase [Puia sp.]
MRSTRIFVTGANGQLGRELRAFAGLRQDFEFFFFDRATLPVEDPDASQAFLAREKPQWLINCAGYTAVDKAESEKETAFEINGDAPGYLAAACRNNNTRLIHISTDYVFDGSSATPLKETDPTGPINSYGASKLEGERQALQQYPDGTVVIRTSWVYSEFGNNFVKTMIRLMRERPAINVVSDQIGSPTYAADLAATIVHIAGYPTFTPGLFHYSNEGRISWYEFAVAIRDAIGSPCTVNPIPTSQYPTPAKRPHYSLLDKTRIRDTWQLTIPDWRPSLLTCLRKLGIPPTGIPPTGIPPAGIRQD